MKFLVFILGPEIVHGRHKNLVPLIVVIGIVAIAKHISMITSWVRAELRGEHK